MAPKSISHLSEAAALAHLLLFAARHGMSATREAVTGGQYQYATGLFFGGARRSWSASTLETLLKQYGKGVSKAVFLDVHTGLGPHGAAEIISNSPKDSEQFARTRAIWGGMVKTTKAEESVSADLTGTLKLAVIQALPDTEVTAASIEFGTVPALVALRALRAENWLHHSEEFETTQARRIKGKLLAAFNPNSVSWRRAVWQKGSSAVGKALDCLDHQPLTSDLKACKQESEITTVN